MCPSIGQRYKEIHHNALAFVRRYSRVRWYKGWRWEESHKKHFVTNTATKCSDSYDRYTFLFTAALHNLPSTAGLKYRNDESVTVAHVVKSLCRWRTRMMSNLHEDPNEESSTCAPHNDRSPKVIFAHSPYPCTSYLCVVGI